MDRENGSSNWQLKGVRGIRKSIKIVLFIQESEFYLLASLRPNVDASVWVYMWGVMVSKHPKVVGLVPCGGSKPLSSGGEPFTPLCLKTSLQFINSKWQGGKRPRVMCKYRIIYLSNHFALIGCEPILLLLLPEFNKRHQDDLILILKFTCRV